MREAVGIGAVAGGAVGGWSAITMFWPVSYVGWDVGRSVIFVSLIIAFAFVARRVTRRGGSSLRAFVSVAVAFGVAACVALAFYLTVTGPLASRIVQLPEYARDYSYHGYTSPAAYLAEHYWDLFRLQVFSWTSSGVIVVTLAGLLGRMGANRRSSVAV